MLFALYVAGIVSSFLVAFVLKLFAGARRYSPLMLELPDYQWPHAGNLALGLWERVKIFVSRVGGIILALTIILWVLSTYPGAAAGRDGPRDPVQLRGPARRDARRPCSRRSASTGRSPIALVPGLAAREVAVSALGTVYAMSATGDDVADQLEPVIAQRLESRHRLFAAGLVRVRAAVPVDARGRETRDELLALSFDHGRLSLRARVSRRRSSPTAPSALWTEAAMQQVIVALIVLVAIAFSVWKLMPARHRLRALDRHRRLGGPASAARRLARTFARSRESLRAGGAGCGGCAANPAATAVSRRGKFSLAALLVSILVARPRRRDASTHAPCATTGRIGHRIAPRACRIVSLAPGTTAMLYAAGAGACLVGTIAHSTEPAEAASVPVIGDAETLDFERLLALRPSVVVVAVDVVQRVRIDRLRALGIPVYQVHVTRLAQMPDSRAPARRARGHRASVAAKRERARAPSSTRCRSRYRERRPVRVLYQIWDRPIYTIGGRHVIADALTLCGAVNIFGELDTAAPAVTREAAVLRDPRAHPRLRAARLGRGVARRMAQVSRL